MAIFWFLTCPLFIFFSVLYRARYNHLSSSLVSFLSIQNYPPPIASVFCLYISFTCSWAFRLTPLSSFPFPFLVLHLHIYS